MMDESEGGEGLSSSTTIYLLSTHKQRRPTIITPWELSEACCLCCSCCGAITSTEPLAAIVLTAACEGSR